MIAFANSRGSADHFDKVEGFGGRNDPFDDGVALSHRETSGIEGFVDLQVKQSASGRILHGPEVERFTVVAECDFLDPVFVSGDLTPWRLRFG